MWKKVIPYNGFVSQNTMDVMYSHLPILAVFCYEGMYPTIEYIDRENWMGALADFYKGEFKYWMPCGRIDE